MCLPRTVTNPSLPPTISLIPTKAMGCGAAGPPAVHPFTQDQERPMKLMHIDSRVLAANSVSRHLPRSAGELWRAAQPGASVSYRVLAARAPGHLSAEMLGAASLAPAQRSARQREEMAIGEELLAEYLATDE